TMAAQMHANPQVIWRFLLGETSLQGGKRNLAAFGNFLQLPQQLQSNATTLLEQADMRGLFASTAMSHADKAQLNTRVQAFVRAIAGMRVPEVLGHVAAMAKQQE